MKKYNKKNIFLIKTNSLKKNFGFFNVRILNLTFLDSRNTESLRRHLSRKLKKRLKYSLIKSTIKVPLYKKPLKVRMGKGKGKIFKYIFKIKKNQKILEISFLKKKRIIFFFLKLLEKKLSTRIFIST